MSANAARQLEDGKHLYGMTLIEGSLLRHGASVPRLLDWLVEQ